MKTKKVRIENPRIIPEEGDSLDALQRALYGYYEFEDCDLQTQKKIVEELRLFYDKEDMKKAIRKSVVLGNDYGDHLTAEEKYHALRDACDWMNLYHDEGSAIEFVSDEMNSIVGKGNWWWERGHDVLSILPKTDVFEPESEGDEEEEESEEDEEEEESEEDEEETDED